MLQASLSVAETGFYPTQKPLRWLQDLIALTTCENDLVLDPSLHPSSTQSLVSRYLGFGAQAEHVAICK